MKYKRVWFFGGDERIKGDPYVSPEDDFVKAYVAETGAQIDCRFGFDPSTSTYYEVGGKLFYRLKDAKHYVETGEEK